MFNPDIVELQDDFDWSNDELRIAQEVFYRDAAADGDKNCAAVGVTNSTIAEKKVYISPFSNSENSSVTSQVSLGDPCQKEADQASLFRVSQTQSSFKGSTANERISHDLCSKRMKLSVNELSKFFPYLDRAVASSIPLKQVVSGMRHTTQHSTFHMFMCHVVESSSDGLTSSCYLLKQDRESDPEGNLGDHCAPNGSSSGSDGSEIKQVDFCKSIASPISEESSAAKLLVPSHSVAAISESESLLFPKRRSKIATCPQLDYEDVQLTGNGMKDLSAFLRSKVYQVLKRAGWSPENQIRNDGRNRYLYRSPEGRIFRDFPSVWYFVGHRLFAHKNSKMMVDDKHWSDFNKFYSELFDTLRHIEDQKDYWESRCGLTCLWKLLDPFVNVILVNRKINALRTGNLVRTIRSYEFDMDEAEAEFKRRCRRGKRKRNVNKHGAVASDTVETHHTRSLYVSEGSSMLLVKTIDEDGNQQVKHDILRKTANQLSGRVSDDTCLQYPSDLSDILVGSGDHNMTHRQCEAIAAHQDSSMSSPGYKHNLESSESNSKDAAVCIPDEGSKPLQRTMVHARVDWTENIEGKYQFPYVDLCELCRAEAGDLLHRNNQLELAGTSRWSMNDAEHEKISNKFSVSLFEEQNSLNPKQSGLKRSKIRKSPSRRNRLVKLNTEVNPDDCNKGMKSRKQGIIKRRSGGCRLKDDDLLISAIIKKRSFKSGTRKSGPKPRKCKSKSLKKRKGQKGSCRLRLRGLGKGGKHFIDRWTLTTGRTVLSWLIIAEAVSINETVHYRDPKDDAVVKDGVITRDGILCKCCSKVFCVSGFKMHAGFNHDCPCLNLFIESGRPYTLCQLQAWSAEYKARRSCTQSVTVDEFDKNDDSCGLCGDGGELLCCDNCPSTFHQTCLSAEDIPEGSWYCQNCTCQVCGQLAIYTENSSSYAALRCSQCEKKYHEACLSEKGMDWDSGASWCCGVSCKEVYAGLQSFVGLSNQIGDGYSWTLLRCIDDDQKVSSAQHLALKAECNSKLAVAVTIMEECFLSMIDPRTGIDMIPQVVYNWGSEFARLDYHGFYTAVLEKDDILISVASIRMHGVAVAEMPLIATCSKYRRQGMCRRLVTSIEKMLISLKVEKLVVAAISDLVETWTVGFGFVPMEEEEKRSLKEINFMVFPGTVMLKKTLYVNQATDLPIAVSGVQPELALEKDEPFNTGASMEGVPDRKITTTDSVDGTVKEVACELKVELKSSPDTEEFEAQKSSKAAGEMELKVLKGFGSIEPECGEQETVATVQHIERVQDIVIGRAESATDDLPMKLSEVPECVNQICIPDHVPQAVLDEFAASLMATSKDDLNNVATQVESLLGVTKDASQQSNWEDKESAVGIATGAASGCENVTNTTLVSMEVKEHVEATEGSELVVLSTMSEVSTSKSTTVEVKNDVELAEGEKVEAVRSSPMNSDAAVDVGVEPSKGMEMWDYWEECVDLEPLDGGIKLADQSDYNVPSVVTEVQLSLIQESQEASVLPQS